MSNNANNIEKIDTLTLAREGMKVGGHHWYRDGYNDAVIVANRLGVDVELFAYSLAVFSPRVAVSRSCRLAVEFCKNPQAKPVGCMGSVYKTALKWLKRGKLNGPKTEAFRRSIASAGKTDALCLDVHMANIFGVEQKDLYKKSVFPAIEANMKSTALALGLSMAECQAAVWCGHMIASGLSNEKRRLIPDDVLNAQA